MKIIWREKYLANIRPFYDSQYVKVLTGIRRCGKSILLQQIMQELINNGVDAKQIINIDLESINYVFINNGKKLLKLFKNNPECLRCYLSDDYEGCSQECMNSHYYANRFDKVPNIWNFNTIEKLSKIIESKQNNSKIKIGFKDEFYDMPYDLETNVEIGEIYKNVINTDGMPYHMKKFFDRICDGYDAKILL